MENWGLRYTYCTQVFYVRNCIFRNISSSLKAGAFLIQKSTVTIERCSLDKLYSSNGGVFYVDLKSELTMLNSVFTNISAELYGGAVYVTSECKIT